MDTVVAKWLKQFLVICNKDIQELSFMIVEIKLNCFAYVVLYFTFLFLTEIILYLWLRLRLRYLGVTH